MPLNLTVTPVLRITALNNCLTLSFPHPYDFKGEFHPFWEMVYALEDGFQVAEREKVYTMKKGDVIFHKPMAFHRLWSLENQDVRAFLVGFCGEGQLLEQLKGSAFVLSPHQQQYLEQLLADVQQQFPRQAHKGLCDHLRTMAASENALQIQRFVDSFQLFLLSLARENAPLTVKEISDSEATHIYQQTVELLTQNVDSWITADVIARQLGCSVSRLKRIFAKFSDIGIHKYLLKLKTAKAIRLLRQGESCSEISRILGFGNQNYFSTVFKRETGFPPSHYTSNL